MHFKELIEGLAGRIGIDGDIVYDEEGVWRIGSEEVVFAFREIHESDSLLIYASLGELPVEGAEMFKTAILRANFLERGVPGGAFSLDGQDRIWVHRYFSLKALDVATLAEAFEDFATLVFEWIRLKEAHHETAERTGARPDPEALPDVSHLLHGGHHGSHHFGTSGILHV